jgi:hypothetical protein
VTSAFNKVGRGFIIYFTIDRRCAMIYFRHISKFSIEEVFLTMSLFPLIFQIDDTCPRCPTKGTGASMMPQ